ncbi:unnamed protein product [Closterium sp. Naga37s-1]|nr:unnamed protein product [Closterium sp. Naga37s-1]
MQHSFFFVLPSPFICPLHSTPPQVLHKVGAERAAAAVITLDTPGANYRAVWALSKSFPHVKTFVRAHDVTHGINLEKAGATAVVPETLEPSLQLAAAVLAQAKLPAAEIAATLDDFRTRHLAELTELSALSGSSLGYGYSSNLMRARVAEAAVPLNALFPTLPQSPPMLSPLPSPIPRPPAHQARRRKAGAREGGVVLPVASISWRHQQLASALANSNANAGAAAAAGGSGASGGASGTAAGAAAGGGAAKEADKEMNPANPMHLHAAPPASPPPPPKTARKRRKAKPTDLINQRRWQQFYRNMVLIVNYKRPQQMPVTLDLLHSLYGSLFQRILAVSEFGDADLGVLESPVKETGHGHDLPPGSLHYSVLPKLLTWHPMAEGFLWMDDDTVLNYWTMSRDNKSRIWFLGPMHQSWRIASLDPSGSVAGGWGGEGKEAGAVRYMEDASERVEESGEALQLLKQAVSQSSVNPCSLAPLTRHVLPLISRPSPMLLIPPNALPPQALSHLPQQYLQRYQQSISPKTNIFLRAASNVFYIPQRHAPAMRSLVPIFADHRIVADVSCTLPFHSVLLCSNIYPCFFGTFLAP